MLTELCKEVNNYFCKEKDIIHGKFSVVDGKLTPPVDLLDDQYFRITESVFNDGVYKNTEELQLKDEPEFSGAIWKMKVEKEFEDLAKRISEWRLKNESLDSENMSPFQSESFFEYSYSKGSSGGSKNGAGGTAVNWRTQFAKDLEPYRRIRSLRP
jgi:hypothetical protein